MQSNKNIISMVNNMLNTKMDAKCLIKIWMSKLSAWVALLTLLLPTSYSIAQTYMNTQPIRTGVVMARAMVLDNNGQPILVEYKADGTEGSVIDLPSDYKNKIRELQIISATEYHKEKQRLVSYQEQYSSSIASGAILMTRQQFEQGTYPTADGKVNITPPKLPAYAKSVLVRGRSNRILNEPSELVLLNFSVDLTQNYSVPATGSVVLNPQGQIIASSQLNIAPRVGFFGDPNQKQISNSIFRKRDDQVFGPVSGVMVQVNEVFPGGMDVTNSEGKYTFSFRLPPCPGFDFDWTIDVYANLNYTGFNPNGSATLPYYMRRQSWSMCMGIHALMFPPNSAYYEIEANSAASRDIQTLDFRVDVMFVSGRILIGNKETGPIPVGTATEYEVAAPDNSPITQTLYDFDNDGKPDTSTLGEMVEKTLEDGSKVKVFEAKDDGTLQAVYFSSRKDTNPEEPDVIRQADTKKNFQANGLLKSISRDDFKKTDILIFRESTGQLVLERRGMSTSDMNSRDADVAKDNAFYYRLMLRGPTDNQLNIGGGITRNGSWEEWSSQYKMTEPFQKREADHLKSGEWIRVVAINRATGYMATQRVQLSDASQNEGGFLNVPLQDMTLMPPNLKVWAERSYDVDDGLTQGEDRHYLIGAEGAALTSDTYIRVYTEWLDEEGRALPEDLGKDNGEQYGLTGRLAKVVAENVLTPVSGFTSTGSDLANFPIAPGRNTQVLRLNDNLTTPEHFYIHVSGTQKDESPDFGTSPEREGILATRPKNVTPFLTPLYDENKNWKTWNAYRDLKREQASQETPVPDDQKPIKPLPTYVWGYRPEYQFSQYQLELDEINRVTLNAQGQEEKTNLLDSKTPLISSTDELIEILYSLFGNDNPRLDPIDGPQDLVLALGEEELKLELGEDKQIRFDNIEHLASLTPEDFLTLRLYTNQDAGNILWEYAFEYIFLDTQLAGFDVNAGRTLYVSADDPVVPLQARVVGYANRPENAKNPLVVIWSAPGAQLTQLSEKDDKYGVFFNEVTLPSVTGAYTQVELKLVSDESTRTKLPRFEVVPGVPAQIEVVQSNEKLSVGGIGEKTLTFIVRDKNNNLVADGTGVSFFPQGSLLVVDEDDATTNGRASVRVTGGDYVEDTKLEFRIGDQVKEVDLSVRPLRTVISTASDLKTGQSETVQVTVTDQDGNPAVGASVSLTSSYGFLQTGELVTDSSGVATTLITTPGVKGTGEVTAQIGMSAVERKTIDVDYEDAESRDLEVNNAAMVGDKSAAGSITYDRFDGQSVNIAYPTSSAIQLKGAPGSDITVRIGDQHDPNLAPVAAYYFGNVEPGRIDDDAGRYELRGVNLAASRFARMGGTSLALTSESKLWGDKTGVGLVQNTGFNLEILPRGEEGGAVINLGQGGQQLTYSNMRFTYSVKTNTGTHSVTSDAIFPGRWYQVAARYHQGKLELWVNQNRVETLASGDIQYQWTANQAGNDDPDAIHDLEIGGDFEGNIDNLKWYNWSASPLVTFDTGETQKTVSLAAATEQLVIKSTGKLHELGGNLGVHRVAIYTDKVHQYTSLMSTDTFTVIAGMSSESTPLSQQTVALPLSFLFPQAHAYPGESLVNWFLPVQEVKEIIQQLTYAVTDPEKFEPDVLVVNFIIAVTYLPPGRVLQPFAKTLGVVFKTLKAINPKFMKYFAGMFKGVMSRAKKGDFDTLWNMLPFFMIVAEMYEDEEAREGLKFLFETVDSGEDVLSWVDYLALPDGDWEGDETPELSLLNEAEPELPLSFMMNKAYAQIKLKRVSGKVTGKFLMQAKGRLSKKSIDKLPDALKIISKEVQGPKIIKYAGESSIRKYLFRPTFLVAAMATVARRGANGLKAFLTGKTNARFKPVTVLAMVGYVEWEAYCGELLDKEDQTEEVKNDLEEKECGNFGLRGKRNRDQLDRLYTRFLADSLNSKYDEERDEDEINYAIYPSGHGALFHFQQIAYYLLLQRAGGEKLKEIEGSRWVWLYEDAGQKRDYGGKADRNEAKAAGIPAWNRNVDIVLETSGGKERWIELKSYTAKEPTGEGRLKLAYLKGKPISQWGAKSKASGNMHKQFLLDRAAAEEGQARWRDPDLNTYKTVGVDNGFKWYFQRFRVAPPKTKAVEVSPLFGKVADKGTIYFSMDRLAYQRDATYNQLNWAGNISIGSHIDHADLRAFLGALKDLGFREAAEALLEEPEKIE